MPLHLIRHADAGSRAQWTAPDEVRPLTPLGEAQAQLIAADLAGDGVVGHGITHILSSPSIRCRQTVEPLAERLGLEVVNSDAFAEGSYGTDALDAALDAVARHTTVAICSHGDVIPALVAAARRRGAELHGPPAPAKGARYRGTVEDGQVVRLDAVDAPTITVDPPPVAPRSGTAAPSAR